MNNKDLLKAVVSQRRAQNLKIMNQTGTTHLVPDRSRTAQLPGKRISKTGKIYWETRKNRSDAPFKKV